MICLNKVKKYIGKNIILDNVDCLIDDTNGIVRLTGKNGAGKTTLLKVIAGIYDINSGNISYDDINTKYYMKWAHRNVVYISTDERNLFYKNSVYDNILYFALLKGVNKSNARVQIEKYLKVFDFERLKNRRVEELSTGQKKIVKILCGFCNDCHFVLFDEPTLGLDREHIELFYRGLNLLSQERKIIIVSHDDVFIDNLTSKCIGFSERNTFSIT